MNSAQQKVKSVLKRISIFVFIGLIAYLLGILAGQYYYHLKARTEVGAKR